MPTTTALHITSLDRELRKDLERTIGKARKAAETGARRALEGMGVHLAGPPAHLDKAGRELRKALRAHGRQAGDVRQDNGEQDLAHLVQEVAYAHWHRMLFARFLAENELLISYEYGVVVDLANAAERAEALGMRDVWEYAAKCAQPMLPQIFPADDPVLQLALPPETVGALTELLNALPPAVFQATDSLGWVYQFWQTERKKEVNDRTRAGQEVEADDISPVTQLFTEDYMVLFLLHNTLGAWWAGKRMQEEGVAAQLEACASEADCRAVVALPGVDWSYLRWRKLDDGTWTPAAGTFDKWPRAARELKVLDPCMGSGHFLVFALPMLVALRQAEEHLDTADAVTAVLRDNLYGLELDPRCTQIAAFNLALAAWKMAGHQALPALHIACSGLAPNSTREEWAAIAELAGAGLDADEQARMKAGMEKLYDLFAQAPTLGSLVDPNRISWDMLTMSPAQVMPLLDRAVQLEGDIEVHERATAAQGLAKAAELLAGAYTLVVTNVPYLGHGDHDPVLKSHIKKFYNEGRSDLATAFLLRTYDLLGPGSALAVVTPEGWLYKDYYKKMRERIVKSYTLQMICPLGAGAFMEITGEEVKPQLFISSNERCAVTANYVALDCRAGQDPEGISDTLRDQDLVHCGQRKQLENAKSTLDFNAIDRTAMLGRYATYHNGICAGDLNRFTRDFTELDRITASWSFIQSTTKVSSPYAGLTSIFLWEEGNGAYRRLVEDRLGPKNVNAWIRGTEMLGEPGILISATGVLKASLFAGVLFDENTVALKVEEKHLPAVWLFASSGRLDAGVRAFDTSRKVRGPIVRVAFDYEEWNLLAKEKFPNGLPEPESNDPTQWLFHGHPARADRGTQLQVAVARLLGYRWPAEHDKTMRLSERARGLVVESEALLPFADGDGIVCLSAVQREQPAYKRLQALLATAYGAEWSPAKERELLAAAGHPEESLEEWLRDSFFKEHCKLFHDRPFVWHVWDGLKDGFHALVNYHQLAAPDGGGKRTLEKLIYTYLGDWITRQEQASAAGADGAAARLAAAQKLKAELEKILAGEPPYDLFIRWKPLHQQPLGWAPDINDGVRLNIRPWLLANDVRYTGAGVLRAKPNIKWGPKPDRGQEPQRVKSDYPWFWNWDQRTTDFTGAGDTPDGARWNDLHYTLDSKRAARHKHESQ